MLPGWISGIRDNQSRLFQETQMGLRTRIIAVVVISSSIINLFLCFYITDQVRKLEFKSLQAKIDKAAYVMRIVNTLPLYNVDVEILKMNMETFFDDENMKSIAIQDSDIDINIHLEREFAEGGTDIKRSFFIDYNGLKLGKLSIVYSTSLIEKKLTGFRTRMLWFTFTAILVMAGVLVFLINAVIKPVTRLANAASEIAAGNLDKEITETGVGEVGTLSRNFASMRDAVKEKIEDLAHTNKVLEEEVRHKNLQEKKILHQSMVISSVNTFFQHSMTARSIREIARLFIPVAQAVVPGPYCFVGVICEMDNYLDILALSREAEDQCPIINPCYSGQGLRQHISGRLVKAMTDKTPVISNKVPNDPDFFLVPENHLPIDSIMVVPLLHGPDVLGLIAFAGKKEGYTSQDLDAAQTMGTALVEALSLRTQQDEKRRLEEMVVQTEKMVSVGQLAAGMAHEINSPLAEILHNIQVIRHSIDSPTPDNLKAAEKYSMNFSLVGQYMDERGVFQSLSMIMAAGKKASDIVSNLLSFSRKSKTDFEPADISLLLDQALELASNEYGLGRKIKFSQIQILRDYAPDLPSVECRPGEIKQVFFNILLNGVQAMADNGDEQASPTFFIRTLPVDDNICIEIRDNGPGMDEEVRRRIFEPFFTTRLDEKVKGLGLSVSYFIITKNHNGTIEVASASGEGTCFKLLLPRHPS